MREQDLAGSPGGWFLPRNGDRPIWRIGSFICVVRFEPNDQPVPVYNNFSDQLREVVAIPQTHRTRRDASHLCEVERRVQHAARPGFRIMELQLSPTQKVPWHSHTNITDTFYVLEGHMRLFLQDPKEEVNLKPGEIHVVRAARPHLVTNGGTKSLTFLVLQGIGEYDYVPLTSR